MNVVHSPCKPSALKQRLVLERNIEGTDIQQNYKLAGLSKNAQGEMRWVVDKPSMAKRTLHTIDKFIKFVDSKRAALGAIQNRMESTIRNQSSISENE